MKNLFLIALIQLIVGCAQVPTPKEAADFYVKSGKKISFITDSLDMRNLKSHFWDWKKHVYSNQRGNQVYLIKRNLNCYVLYEVDKISHVIISYELLGWDCG